MKNITRQFALLPRSILLGLLFVAGIFSIIGSNGPIINGPLLSIGPNDTFMFSYIDRQERIRVRWSQDGWRWEDANIQTGSIHDSGVGLASSVDNVGALRWLAYPNISGRLVLHAAIGAVFDSGGGTNFNNVSTHGAPTITEISGTNWVVGTLGGSLNQSAVFNVFDAPSTLTDITSTIPATVQNNQLLRPPQMISRNGTFVAAWMRWQVVGTNRVPINIRVLRGTDSGGTINWQGDSQFTITEAGFSAALTDPALTHDGSAFLLGVIRRENSTNDEYLFIYRSSDAVTWTLSEKLEVPFGTGTTVRIAAHGTEKMFVGVNGTSSASFYRKWKGEFESVRGANVYGTRRPNWYRFSIIAAGRPRPDIYVNHSVATSGDGSQSNPYKTIREATDNAKRGDRILVAAPAEYQENVTLPVGVTLEGWNGFPQITVTGFDPAITAEGDNYIKGVTIRNYTNASAGVLVDLETALDGLEGSGSAAYLDVEDSDISTQNFGVVVESGTGLSFGQDNERVFRPRIKHNVIRGHAMGIKVEVNGPSTGSLQIPIEAYNNLLYGNFTGIHLKMIGGGPNIGGFAHATITGRIRNNLIIDGNNGVSFQAENAGTILTPLFFNTIARNYYHNVICSADPGPHGQSRVRTRLACNLLTGAGQFGFIEFTDRCNPSVFDNNIFFGNGSNYDDYPAMPRNTAAQINSTTGGSGNLVADPLYERGGFRWRNSIDYGEPGHFFLEQTGGTVSPAVNLYSGPFTLEDNGLNGLSTRTDYTPDAEPPDAGFHYSQ